MTPESMPTSPLAAFFQRWALRAMAACLAVMALSVFINVVLRYGFGSGLPATEELSRLLFVWMVFIGAAAAYPAGEHMAFTGLAQALQPNPVVFALLTAFIRILTIAACIMLAWGAWQQVAVGLNSHSVVLGYPDALLPLPAFLASACIGVMALAELIMRTPWKLGHNSDLVE